jgi:hypothetical protein
MRSFALALDRKLLLAVAAAAALTIAATPSQAQPDPPAQGGRISYITGAVSIQPAGSDNWEQAIPNLPLGPGDRVFTDSDGEAEIQVGETFVRIGPNADVSLIDSTPTGLYFGVAQGSVHLHAFNFWPGQRLYVNTPSGTSSIAHPGEMRVDVYPDQQAALFTDLGSNTIITGADGFNQEIGTGMALELMGSNPVTPQWLDTAPPDALDNWSVQRDQQIAQAQSYQYVSREIPGAYELDAAGTWQPGTPYGAVWFPNNVEAGWAPYHNGHWINHAPWGYVWVEDESWGYAPFHYGRWVSYNGRWGWVAGPPAAHPIWSPALVVFAGGISVGGGGVSAWFPLGPGEVYHPWYPCSPRYVDQVNITNIVEAPRVHVQTTYVNINITNVTYVNRTIAVTAISQADFASGRPVRQAAVKIDVNMIQHAQPLATPSLPRPNVSAMVGHPPARPVRVAAARPVLINENGKAVSAKPGAVPMAPPVKPAPPAKALPGHTAIAAPANAKPQVGGKPPAPVVPAKTAPAEKAAPEKPAPPTAAKPPVKPAPAPATTTKPGAATPVKPIPAATPAPAVKPGTTPPAKPGTTPPAKTDKDKKAAKDKDKDKNKDPDDQDKKPQ